MSTSPRYYCLAPRPLLTEPDGGSYYGLPPGTLGAVDLAPVGGVEYVFATSDAPFGAEDVAARIGDGTRLQDYKPTAGERAAWTALLGVSWTPGWTLLDALWAALTVQADPDGELRAKPILPTHRGVLELHLGGHSLIRSERLPARATDHPAWPAIQRVLQRDYARIREQAHKGHRGRGEPDLHRKWLGAMRRKYRMSDEAASRLLIPQGLPRELPTRPTTTVSDDFNRADAADPGANWAKLTGNWSIVSNQLFNSGGGLNPNSARYETDLSSDDQYAELDYVSGASDSIVCAAVRFDPAAKTYYSGMSRLFGSTRQILRIVNGAITNLTSDSGGSGPPKPLRIEVDGSTVTLYDNGVLGLTVSDTAITGYLRTGVIGHAAVVSTADNFVAGDLLAPPTAKPWLYARRTRLIGAAA